jgi:hypothetical protein
MIFSAEARVPLPAAQTITGAGGLKKNTKAAQKQEKRA